MQKSEGFLRVHNNVRDFSVILFLDFDGVVHPERRSGKSQVFGPVTPPFCLLPKLVAVLRDFHEVGIVISSSWKTLMPLHIIRLRFPDDISARIVGSTPEHQEQVAGERQREIEEWLQEAQYTGPYVILDDIAYNFEPGHPPLILIDPEFGITDQDMALLRERFEDFRSKR